MKKCPFCNAEIQDNARFCLYCMTPLEEKTVILPARRKRWLWWLPAVAVVLLLGAVLWRIAAAPERNADTTLKAPEDTTAGTTQNTEETTEETEPESSDQTQLYVPPEGQTPPRQDDTPEDAKPTPTPPQSGTSAAPPTTEVAPPATEVTPPATEATPPTTEPTPPTTESPPPATEETVPTTESPNIDYGNGKPGTTGYRTMFSIAFPYPEDDDGVPFNPVGTDVFWYSAATAAQMEAAGYSPDEKGYAVTDNASHIRCGIYEVPSKLNGTPVVHIAGIGLSDVVKFTVPKSVKSLPSRAFYNCYELKYLCIKGDLMTIPKNAFPPSDKRWYTIVIRCSADCKDENGRYWKNIAGEYGAVWEAWNG